MASYYGPGLAASALTNAIGSMFKGLNEGEDARTKREFLEAEIAKMRRDPITTMSAGQRAFRRNPDGSMTQVAETPENPQELAQAEHFRVLTDKAREEMQLGRDFRPQLQQLYDEMIQGGVPPWYAHGVLFAQTPAQLEQVLARIGPQLFKVKPEPKTSMDLMRLLEDPSVPPEDKARYKAILDRYTGQQERLAGVRATTRQEVEDAAKARDTLGKIDDGLHSIDIMEQLIQKLDKKGLLPPKDSSKFSLWWSEIGREWLNPSDPDLVGFKGLFGPIMIGQIDRSLYDEKGIRAVAAFAMQFDLAKNMPSKAGFLGLFNALRASIKTRAARLQQQVGQSSLRPLPGTPNDQGRRGFGTPFLVRDKATGLPGTLTLDPGEQIDTSKYEVLQ